MTFEESKACVELICDIYGFDVTVNENFLDCAWLGMPDMADFSWIVVTARNRTAESGDWLRMRADEAAAFWCKACDRLSNVDLYMRHCDKTTGKQMYLMYASVPEFSSFDELQLKLACVSRVLDDAPWRELFHRFCSKYRIRCQFSDYGDWNKDQSKYKEFWFLSETAPDCGAGVSVCTDGEFCWSHNTTLLVRFNRVYDASAVMRSIAGKRIRIDGRRRVKDIVLDMPPMNEDTTAEEYALRLAVNGLT